MRQDGEFSNEVLSDSLEVFWYKSFCIRHFLVLNASIA